MGFQRLVVVFLHEGVPIAIAPLGIPPCTQRPPRLPSTPASTHALLPAEVLPEHQIHLGRLPPALAVSLTLLIIYITALL